MKRLGKRLFVAALALIMVFALSATAFADGEATSAVPADGTYKITVETGEKMFKVTDAELIVENGTMTAVVTLSGTGYGYLYAGTVNAGDTDGLDTVAEADRIAYVENEQGEYTYEVPVAALNKPLDFGSFSTKNQVWYDRHLTFKADTLAFIEGLETEPPVSEPSDDPGSNDNQNAVQPTEKPAKDVPKTSDDSAIFVMIALLVLSAGAAVTLKKKTA